MTHGVYVHTIIHWDRQKSESNVYFSTEYYFQISTIWKRTSSNVAADKICAIVLAAF